MEKIRFNAPVSKNDLDAILSFIPRLLEIIPDKVVLKSPGRLLKKNGNNILLAMHGEYDPLVQEFQDALYRHRFVRNFDWGKWVSPAKAIFNNPERLRGATMITCVKLLMLHARNDRFVDGHFASMLTSGHITAILRRMQQLRDGDSDAPISKEVPSHVKIEHHIYLSNPSGSKRYAPRFEDPESIQTCLTNICEAWVGYLQKYLDRTAKLFGNAELPWESTERAIVSTLSAAIVRSFPGSIVIEESRVLKPGKNTAKNAKKTSDLGRCDLWASLPEPAPGAPSFSFYLEAKKSLHPRNRGNLEEHLTGKYGISKIFRDFMASDPKILAQRSAYRNDQKRKHEHYIIGLLVTPLEPGEGESKEIQKILRNTYEKNHKLYLRASETDAGFRNDRRQMARYPTVALTVFDPDGQHNGTIASFTVLGSTSRLSSRGATKKDKV